MNETTTCRRTLVVELRAEPFGRWFDVRIDKTLMPDFLDVLRSGLQVRGVDLDVRIVAEESFTAPAADADEQGAGENAMS